MAFLPWRLNTKYCILHYGKMKKGKFYNFGLVYVNPHLWTIKMSLSTKQELKFVQRYVPWVEFAHSLSHYLSWDITYSGHEKFDTPG